MKGRWAIFLLFPLLFWRCGEPSSNVDETDKVPVPPASVFIESEYFFCGDEQPDRFLVGYQGEKADDNQIQFYIICHSGDTLIGLNWEAENFLPDSLKNAVEGPTREAIIQRRIRALVIENPPRKIMDTIPGYGPVSPERMAELDTLQAARVFVYRLGSGKSEMVAWSMAKKQAVPL